MAASCIALKLVACSAVTTMSCASGVARETSAVISRGGAVRTTAAARASAERSWLLERGRCMAASPATSPSLPEASPSPLGLDILDDDEVCE